jgi:hypothetical protein
MDQQPGLAAPGPVGTHQRAQQQVVDLRVVRAVHPLQQVPCADLVQDDVHGAGAGDGVAVRSGIAVERKPRRARQLLARPVGQLGQQRPALGVGAQALGPMLVRRRLRRRHERFAPAPLCVQALEVLEQHAPRDGIHDEVVNGQQQASRLRKLEQDGPDERTARQVQATLGRVAQGLETPGHLFWSAAPQVVALDGDTLSR